ncbi:hypothetical protein COT78_00275 [Candidatus Berkelbacteria bacterium CG10_big_fil_rev_8_21_14_0_10_43_13]|uniref:histidine kinase n=1 Tax=Candidatus Berkelbacteria bacterium CG10_big_fil_rev_8_21_14_0_10_43_13 TaxID=1974514 RepID=A0A2H0W9N0_9BACT|nr:MAG: hypothetical protein COT78_00275 [Candidatus Berkelbacteria bacterium CG10_big_fil_rev_8_21_14_0_10_43_13]
MDYNLSILLITKVLLVVLAGLTVLLMVWVFLADPKNKVNRTFALMALAFSYWWIGGYFFSFNKDLAFSLWYGRSLLAVVSLSFGLLYYYVTIFPFEKRYKWLDSTMLVLTLFNTILPVTGDLIVKGVRFTALGNNPVFGRAQILFYLWIGIAMVTIVTIIAKKYFQTPKEVLSKSQFLIFGFLIFLGMNLVFNIILPIMRGSIEYWQLGNCSAIFLLGFTAYAITKHHLFNIKVITTEIIVVTLSIVLLVEVFISSSSLQSAIQAIIWLLATFGGYQLIKSVKIEIKQREDLAKLAKELELANEHLKDIDKLKDDFLSMASHELNTPIAAIEGYLSMILQEGMGGKIPDKAREYLETVFTSSQRLANLVRDLLNVSRIESGRIHIIYEQKQTTEIIDQAMMEVASKAREAKHTMTFEKPKKSLPLTWFDVTRVTEILINMLGNSIKYTPDGGKIVIRAVADDQKIVVSVEDNGKGIPKGRGEGVFDKFTQVDVMKDEVKGTGLGMYIAKKFIELMNGKIWFQSDGEGKGTTFYFSLPVLKQKPADPHEGEGAVLH